MKNNLDNRKIKLAIDAHTLESKDWAGKEQYVFELIKALNKKDKLELVIYGRRDISYLRKDLGNNLVFKNKNFRTPFWQFWLLRELKKDEIDQVLIPCTYLFSALNFFTPQIIVVHDLTSFLSKTRKTHKFSSIFKEKLTMFLSIRNSKKIITMSDNTSRDLIERFSFSKKKVRRIYPGFRLRGMEEQKVTFLKEPIILSVGTIEPRKNTVAIVEAFEKLKKERPEIPWKLVIIGKVGWKSENILERINSSSYIRDIEIKGYVDDGVLEEYYKKSLCLVYPSLYEGFGSPPLEAMGYGCPVIVSQNSSLPEVVGEAGLFFNKDNDIADIIVKLRDDEGERNLRIEKGLEQVKKFNWENISEEIINFIAR